MGLTIYFTTGPSSIHDDAAGAGHVIMPALGLKVFIAYAESTFAQKKFFSAVAVASRLLQSSAEASQ
jgi:hypothetical protein